MSKSLATKNVAAVLIGLGLVLAFTFSFATTAKADALSDLQAQVNSLLAQIAALQGSSVSQQPGGLACNTFTQTLTIGSTGTEVMWVQKFLNSVDGTQLGTTGAGSPGNETSYFGSITRAAVSKFQQKYGITPTAGYWGPISRAKANSICAGVVVLPPGTPGVPSIPTGPGITVSASAQPANSLAPGGTNRVPFTTFTLTNNTGAAVTVTGVTVQRSGLAVDAVFAGVVLVDEQGLQVGIAKTLNSNHQAIVGDTFTLNAGQTKTFTVSGNMQSAATLASYAGQVVSISVVGVNTSVPVNGSLPITGASQTINSSLTVGSVTTAISSLDPNAANTKNIGDTGVKFSGLRFTAGSAEDLKFYSIRWRLNGTVSASDLANITTAVSGTSYPTTVSSDGRYYTAVFPGGILITKGNSVDVTIQGDIAGTNASGRVAQFDVDKTSDVYFVGQLYGYGIAAAAGSTALSTASTHASALTAGTPWFQGSTESISGASVTTIAKATSVPSQNVAVNGPNQPLGGYVTNFTGEAVSVQGHTFTIATSSGQGGYITNVSIYDENGAVVAGPVDASGTGATLTFSDTITYPTGLHTYTLKGKLPSTYTNGGTIQLSTTPSGWTTVTGQSTGNTVTISTALFTLNTMTVRAAALTMGLSTTPSAQTIVAGGQAVTFANIQLDASASGEDVRINSIPLHVDQAFVAAAGTVTNLTTCQLIDSAGTILNGGSNTVNSFTSLNDATTTIATTYTKTFTLDNSLTIPKGTVVSLALKCNVGSSATANDSYRFKTYSGDTLTFTGVTSGSSASATITSAQAGRQTVAAAGTVTVSADASSPSYALGAGGTTGVTVGVAKFRPSNEAVNLTKVGLTLAGTNGSYLGASGAQDLVNVYIYNGSTLVGNATFTGNATTATSTLLSTVSLPKDVDTKLTLKVDLADVGTGVPGTPGDRVTVDVLNFEGSGASSGSTIMGGTVNGMMAVAGVRLYNTYPTVSQIAFSDLALAGKLIRFSVTANAAGDVGLAKFTFTLATSSTATTIATIGLYGYTDSAFSTAISGQGTGGLIGSTFTATTTASNIQIQTAVEASPVEVPAGQTYYFELRATVGGVTSGNSITTTLLGDSSTVTLAATGSVNANFVWSPNSTTTSITNANDWTSSYGVLGLPTGGFSKSVSQ
ncbi:MAG: peptidoglycan-binding domain-containing protein [bacterium]|nr:peptidoglycan-binding domain-containing protein [bacterium]